MKDVKNGEAPKANHGRFTRGWRQCIYYPFGEKGTERIYMPGNLEEHVVLWLGDHLERGRERPKADFVFLETLREVFQDLFINQQPFYTSSNGILMAYKDLSKPSSPAMILFPVAGTTPAQYEVPRWKIVEALRVMENLEKTRRGMPLDEPEKPYAAVTELVEVKASEAPTESAIVNGGAPPLPESVDALQNETEEPKAQTQTEGSAAQSDDKSNTPSVTKP